MTEQKKTSQDIKLPKAKKCFHCGEYIYNLVDLVSRPVVLSVKGVGKLRNRIFHINCLKDYNEKAVDLELSRAEDTDWDKAYQFFKNRYLKVTKSKDMQHAVERLKGLRVGKYKPSGNNTKYIKDGYSYDTIYKTMVFVYPIAMAKASTMKFADLNHKVNFLMKFIEHEIPNVQYKLDSIEKANESTEKAVVKGEKVFDHYASYKEMAQNTNKGNGKIQTIEEILGYEVEKDDEFEWE